MESNGPSTHINNLSVDITQSMEEDPLVEGPLVSADALDSVIRNEFRELPTSWAALILAVLHVAFVCLSVTLALVCSILEQEVDQCRGYLQEYESKTVILLAKVALWFLFAVFERFVQHHHSRTRNRGYLQFYRSTRNLKRLPLFIHSAGNAAVLIILSAKLSLPSVKHLYMYLLLGVLCLELLLSIPSLLVYTVKVMKFNKEKPGPDINQEERLQAYSSSANLNIHTETGFRDGSNLEEVVEKQADLIEYMKQRNSLLSKRILSLTSQQIRD